MASKERDPLAELEQHRQRLEENVSKLRQSLKHWKTWEFEYEMLKEEIQHSHSPDSDTMLTIGRNLGGTLVNEKEVKELLGPKLQTKRTATQVVNMISRRVDYVQQNISSVENQLQTAEKKVNAATVLLEPDLDDDGGFPLTDIVEELDDEGNVISSSLSHPGRATPGIVNALQTAGVEGLEYIAAASASTEVSNSSAARSTEDTTQPPADSAPTKSSTTDSEVKPNKSSTKKSVKFAEDTKAVAAETPAPALQSTGYNPDVLGFNFNRGEKVIELDENDEEIASYPVIPKDETPEEAALRRQMLQYSLSEVGSVVAEINLETPTVEYDDDEFEEYEDDDSDEDEEEDDHGRTIRPVLTEEYKRQMAELEKKLNATMVENIGPRPEVDPVQEYADDVRRLVVKDDEDIAKVVNAPQAESTKPDSKKKGVRFAEDLDFASPPPPAVKTELPATKPSPPVSTTTIADNIVERAPSAPTQPRSATPSKPSKVSRFKSARSSTAPPAASAQPPAVSPFPLFPQVPIQPPEHPQGPPGSIIAPSVIERAPDPTAVQPPSADGLEPEILKSEIEVAYHKARNRMIQQQGGFLANDEEDVNGDWVERDENGKEKKVSRFRAARLRADGV
jgi:unconventional prefoldin RPB5 interactor 1